MSVNENLLSIIESQHKEIEELKSKGVETMPCNNNCNYSKDRNIDRATVVVVTLMLIAFVSMGYGIWKLFNGNKGQECAVTLQFQDGVKATYIGKSI